MADLGIYFNDAETLAYASQLSSVTVMRTAGPMLLAFIILEGLVSFFRKNKTNSLSDTINRYVLAHPFLLTSCSMKPAFLKIWKNWDFLNVQASRFRDVPSLSPRYVTDGW